MSRASIRVPHHPDHSIGGGGGVYVESYRRRIKRRSFSRIIQEEEE
jgi:hypothetical protein